jgi:hypothetical protein
MTRTITLPALAALLLTAPATAQRAPTDFCAGGEIAVVRMSTLVPGGSRDGFDKAVGDQLAWYRSHGFTQNRLVTAPVIVQDAVSKQWSVSPAEVFTLHINPPPIDAVKPDDAYRAFVAEFRKNSAIASERTICLKDALK